MVSSLFAAILLAAAALGSAYLAGYVWRRRRATSGGYFALCMAAVAWWASAASVTHLYVTLPGKLFWSNLQYIGITLVPLTWVLFALEYSGRGARITPRMKAALCLHPLLVNAALWTNAGHGLFRADWWLNEAGPVLTMGTLNGPLFWLHAVYSYTLLLVGFYYLFGVRHHAPLVYRRQTFALMLALLLPWGANVVTLVEAVPLGHIDLTPFAFAISGVVVTWALLRHQLFDLVPVALGVVIENLKDAIIVLDRQGRVARMNPASSTLLRCCVDDVVGRPLMEVLPHHAGLIERYRHVESASEELVVRAGDTELTLDLHLTVLRDAHGQLIGYLISLRDVTERVRSQAALRTYAERLRVLHEIDHAILAAQSPETIANAALEQIHRLVPSQRTSVLVLDAEDRARLLALRASPPLTGNGTVWRRMLAAGNLKLNDIFSIDTLSDTEETPVFERRLYAEGVRACLAIPLIVQDRIAGTLNLESSDRDVFTPEHADIAAQVATSLAVALENARLYAAAQQELAERKAVEAALRASEATLRQKAEDLVQRNAELDAFARTVAHDLKMPLSLMIGYTSFIEAGEVADDPTQLDWCVHAIGQSARKMSSIIDELLLLSRLREARDVTLMPLDMDAIVSDVLVRFTDTIEQCQVVITRPDAWPSAWGYAPWIEEVWANYLSNAIKYGGTPPRIELGVTSVPVEDAQAASADTLRFWVRDNGRGLTPEQQARLFVPFERLDQARVKGHGLGLSIVQRIIQKLGGTAGVESENGDGSTFYFTLPPAHLPPS